MAKITNPTDKSKGRIGMVITPAQVRMARAALAWTQDDLATRAGVSKPTVADYERGARASMPQNLVALRRTFEEAGLCFVNEEGQRQGVCFSESSEVPGTEGD